MRFLINLYQQSTPIRNLLYQTIGISPHACRHHPTCSNYAKQSFKTNGPILGSFKALKRLISCNPLHPFP